MTVVVLVAGFHNVGRRVLSAVMVMRTEYRPLDQRPEAFDSVGMDKALSVGNGMIDCKVRNPFVHPVVAAVLVRDQYGVISVYKMAQERLQRLASHFLRRLGHYPCRRGR